MGQLMVSFGVPRNTGRIWAYLLLLPGPAGLDQITEELEIAKSGASVATRQLVGFGLARAIGERGSRRVLYEALNSVEAILNARNAQSRTLTERFREGAAVAPSGAGRERMREMAETLDQVLDEFPELLRRIRERRRRT